MVANLFPRSTIVEPNLSISSILIPVILAKRANSEAATSADNAVDSPRSIIVLENFNKFSCRIPNCPATSATFAISLAAVGKVLAISLIPSSNAANSISVASTVLRTPTKADSKSIAVLPAATPNKLSGILTFCVISRPTLETFLPVSFILSPNILAREVASMY